MNWKPAHSGEGRFAERTGEGGGSRRWSSCKLSVNKWLEWQKSQQGQVIGHCLKYGRWWTTELISWASEQHPKSDGSPMLRNKQRTITTCWQWRADWQITDLAPGKSGEAKKQALSKQAQQKANSKAGQLVVCRADLLNLRTACRWLKLPHLNGGGADQVAATERWTKKTTTHRPTT
jgi:hypothetical protein